MGPKLEKGMAPWLWVGGEDGRLLGLDEWGDWLAGVEWSANQSTVSISRTFRPARMNINHISVTYLSWRGEKGTTGCPQTACRGTSPGAPWERRAWSWAAGFYRRPDWRCCSGCTPAHKHKLPSASYLSLLWRKTSVTSSIANKLSKPRVFKCSHLPSVNRCCHLLPANSLCLFLTVVVPATLTYFIWPLIHPIH